jgi:hypothetical protein
MADSPQARNAAWLDSLVACAPTHRARSSWMPNAVSSLSLSFSIARLTPSLSFSRCTREHHGCRAWSSQLPSLPPLLPITAALPAPNTAPCLRRRSMPLPAKPPWLRELRPQQPVVREPPATESRAECFLGRAQARSCSVVAAAARRRSSASVPIRRCHVAPL